MRHGSEKNDHFFHPRKSGHFGSQSAQNYPALITPFSQQKQGRFDLHFRGRSCQMEEETYVVPICSLDSFGDRVIVSLTEDGRRKHVISRARGDACPWCAYERPDHLVRVNAMLLFADQARQGEDQRAAHRAFVCLGARAHQDR